MYARSAMYALTVEGKCALRMKSQRIKYVEADHFTGRHWIEGQTTLP